ncbi:MAG: TetR/AcrR family transcriptional regulator [Caulobacteraceae bacterium]
MKSAYHHGDLRAALLEIGLKLLAERTADDLSLREMAREAGVSATAVYRHFPDKDALMSALALEGLARLATDQRAAFEAAGGGGSGFAATGRAYVRFALANPALFRLIFSSPAPPDVLEREPGAGSGPMAFLKANAAAQIPPTANEAAVRVAAVRAWSLAHGLAMLMLDGQVPAEDSLVDAVLGDAHPGI